MTTLLPLLLVVAMLVLLSTLSEESRKVEKPEDLDSRLHPHEGNENPNNTMCRNGSECARFEFELSSAGKSVSSINIQIQKQMGLLPIKVMACLSNSLKKKTITPAFTK
ncbi:hypothetical protein CEXT_599941 [Caerostris extrusa]|uniref:Uncharacterized protein n=1 Tax=Caerostris extrusa TaxID=172846 RepID=A0AAV4PIP0_CAEEX|nr:hypothetical protein CEXT_599941 [Caerostris extrusa]